MDIRNYFSVLGSKSKDGSSATKGSNSSSQAQSSKASKTKKQKRIIDSDDEDPLPPKKKISTVDLSDSDDDIFSSRKKLESKKSEKTSDTSKSSSSNKTSVKSPVPAKPVKPASAASFFGSAPVVQSQKQPNSSKLLEDKASKRKICDGTPEKKTDSAFEKTLQQLDKTTEQSSKKARHSENESSSSRKGEKNDRTPSVDAIERSSSSGEKREKKSSSDAKQKNSLSKDVVKESSSSVDGKETKSNTSNADPDFSPPKQNENSPPLKSQSVSSGSLASKLSAKVTSKKGIEKEIKTEKSRTPHKDAPIVRSSPRKKVKMEESPRKPCEDVSSPNRRSISKYESSKDSNSPKRKSSSDTSSTNSSKKTKSFDKKHVERELELSSNSPSKDVKSPKSKTSGRSVKSTTKHAMVVTPSRKAVSPDPFADDSAASPSVLDSSLLEEKKKRTANYRKFLARTGPRNPGSKVVPEGAPGCLSGLVFVLSGVLESLDRVEMTELVQRYGGRVVSAVSGKTTHLVVGDDCGASKTAKAEQLGKAVIGEDDVLEMIRTRPGEGGAQAGPVKGDNKKTKNTSNDSSSSNKKAGKPATCVSPSKPALPVVKPIVKASSSQGSSQPCSQSSSQGMSASQSSSQQTQPLSSQDLAGRPSEELMWVDKYKPASLKNIIGQQGDKSNARKLLNWLKNWSSNHSGNKKHTKPAPWVKDTDGAFFKAALLSGPPGVGKTTTAQLVCRELGYDSVELNASDTRSKRSLTEEVAQLLSNTSLSNYAAGSGGPGTSRHHVLLMDEVDGMAGNEDRGGVQELIALMRSSRIPIICMCNDRQHPKIRSLANHCFDLRFYKPRVEQIRGAMMSVCFREGIKMKPEALDQVIMGSNQDVRQVLHHLSMFSAKEKNLDSNQVKQDANKAKKDLKMGPWDVCRQVFSESERRTMTIHQKSDLFFHDYSIGPLFVQENYWKARPKAAQSGGRIALLRSLAKAASSLADGDLVERAIRTNNNWALLPTQAVFSCVLPGEAMSGHLSGEIEFPSWLGNNSKKNKMDRLAQELHMHMKLKISGNKTDVMLDYSRAVRERIVRPLLEGAEGVAGAVEAMTDYCLVREDLDSLGDVALWSGTMDKFSKVESKVKAAFTRALNKSPSLNPYSVVTAPKKKRGGGAAGGADSYTEEGEEDDEEDEVDEDDITADAMIKVKKPASSSTAAASKKGAAAAKGGKGKGKK